MRVGTIPCLSIDAERPALDPDVPFVARSAPMVVAGN
jgi:hypothetical protein